MTRFTMPGKDRFMNGLRNAESKGYAAGEDWQFSEDDNPYRQYEHRMSWLDGFRRARKKQVDTKKRHDR